MTYTHMPFITPEGVYLCVGGDVVDGKYRPWRMSLQKGEDYLPVDFPYQEVSYRKRHCSPVFVNNTLSVTYDSHIFYREGDKWHERSENVQQGFYSGKGTVYCKGPDFFIENEKTDHPFEKLLRIVPYEEGYLVTGYTGHHPWTARLNNGEWQRIKSEGKDVYKCHIHDGTLAHAVQIEKGIECYQIQFTKEWTLEPLNTDSTLLAR